MFENLRIEDIFFIALAGFAGYFGVKHILGKFNAHTGTDDAQPKKSFKEESPYTYANSESGDTSGWFRRNSADSKSRDQNNSQFDSGHHEEGLKDREHSRNWHEILGVSPTAPFEEIKAAYKQKISMYHPDKLSKLGPEFTTIAEAKSKEINIAYNTACKLNGRTS